MDMFAEKKLVCLQPNNTVK
jgi:hypothetical protein